MFHPKEPLWEHRKLFREAESFVRNTETSGMYPPKEIWQKCMNLFRETGTIFLRNSVTVGVLPPKEHLHR